MILVVNADDFGLTEGTNHAIIDAHQAGIVTSTSLLANGVAFHHAIELAKEMPTLGIGVHLTLTEGPPIAMESQKLTFDGVHFPLSNKPFIQALITGSLPHAAIHREFDAQIQKIIDAGIRPTHLDGHKYIHLLPGVTTIACFLANQFDIPFVRIPYHIIGPINHFNRIPGAIILTILSKLALGTVIHYGLRTADHFAGFVDSGHLSTSTFQPLLSRKYNGVVELVCHPAYRSPQLAVLQLYGYKWIRKYNFDDEMSIVSDPELRAQLEKAGWKLYHFGNI
jgi:predicted glycoside hydrolase/deacetylase ChbG (UPF0249 family)